ncbi:MAG: TrmH family RNA methyltransferase [Marinirhabdus sp.]
MISKNRIKSITALKLKKYRDAHGLFVVEGKKAIAEFRREGHTIRHYFTTAPAEAVHPGTEVISERTMQRISFLKRAGSHFAVVQIPQNTPQKMGPLTVVLDAVRDPGNLGTIIRLCDWFGVPHLVCSPDTADCYNPKAVQASMGSLARVRVRYTPLTTYLSKADVPVYGGFTTGKNVYAQKLPQRAIVVLGNEGQGISAAVSKWVGHKISIPRSGRNQRAESLNVATATAILLSEFKRATEM